MWAYSQDRPDRGHDQVEEGCRSTALYSSSPRNRSTSSSVCKAGALVPSPPCLGEGPHGWVPVDTHSTPVLTSVRRLWWPMYCMSPMNQRNTRNPHRWPPLFFLFPWDGHHYFFSSPGMATIIFLFPGMATIIFLFPWDGHHMHNFLLSGMHNFLLSGMHNFLLSGMHNFLLSGMHNFLLSGMHNFLLSGICTIFFSLGYAQFSSLWDMHNFLLSGMHNFLLRDAQFSSGKQKLLVEHPSHKSPKIKKNSKTFSNKKKKNKKTMKNFLFF